MCILITFSSSLSGLRKKTVSPGTSRYEDHSSRGGGTGSTDLFGTADAIVKHVLEVMYAHVVYCSLNNTE